MTGIYLFASIMTFLIGVGVALSVLDLVVKKNQRKTISGENTPKPIEDNLTKLEELTKALENGAQEDRDGEVGMVKLAESGVKSFHWQETDLLLDLKVSEIEEIISTWVVPSSEDLSTVTDFLDGLNESEKEHIGKEKLHSLSERIQEFIRKYDGINGIIREDEASAELTN